MMKKVVLTLLACTLVLGVSACGKEEQVSEKTNAESNQDSQISTLEIMQYDLGDNVETKDELKITLHTVKAEVDGTYTLNMDIESLSNHKDIKADAFLVDNATVLSKETVSFKDDNKQSVKLNFRMNDEATKTTTFTYTGDSNKIWNLELPDLSTVSTA